MKIDNSLGVYDSLLDLIGNTPLLELKEITKGLKGRFFGKLEAFNAGHSAKDRVAKYVIEDAERKGLLKPGSTIVETSSGNTGYSLAMISALRGYKCIIAISDKSSHDKVEMLQALGAEVHLCPANVAPDDPRSYYEVAKRIHQETPNSIYINQYFNPLNPEAHYQSTGREIWEQTQGEITHVVVCSGTGGTISGIARYLKEQNPKVQVLGVDAYGSAIKKYHDTREFDPAEIYPYKIEGMGKNLIPTATNFDVIDEFIKVTDKDAALTARELARTEGLFMGYTSGAAMQAVRQYAEMGRFDENSIVVVLFADHGSRYMNKIYSDEWMKKTFNI
ncbi:MULTISPECIES: PLP-dependent cysteine synthase family protein [Capnocytophaga]|jgi:cystathionine beta-synthase|uniref:PLP-dependent cysteine synthase family protein n=1 Tax=Capnocytophaga TaxID=1016 RepID=UPI00020C7498|nr:MULTISPECIES: cysteine synthase family protein [unclassified Capnocytophaga]KHE68049.1 putative cystathionine beta-synthase [Capnocytophaga sp. oral taxon 329 str. F0087]QGS17326.1 pyridoxal-phosphate dependent enzyme [Capnocytophaga sp. FDAARGOS_737]